MHETVYRVLALVCAVVVTVPLGTNLGLVYVLWMLMSGRLLETRGAVIPGLSRVGLPAPAVRRAWAAVGQGAWSSEALLADWRAAVEQEGRWQAHEHGGYRPVAVDVTGFWRPRLRDGPTVHYDGVAGTARPAIVLGIVARIGSVGAQRLGLPLAAKQLIGAARQFVSAPETCQRLPELALLAGSVLTYVAATQPAVPTGFWDRRPRSTPGRLRRVLAQAQIPTDFPFPARIRATASVTDHLPKGDWGQRRRSTRGRAPTPAPATPEPAAEAA